MVNPKKIISTVAILIAASIALPACSQRRVGLRAPCLAWLEAESVWVAAKELDVQSLEVTVTHQMTCPELFVGTEKPYRIDTPENRQKLLSDAKKNGCEIMAFCAYVYLAEDNTANVERIRMVAEAARQMKVPVVMMPIGAQDLDDSEFLRRATAFLKAVAPVARSTKVQLTIENSGHYLNREEILKPLMEAVPDSKVGLDLDITNMYWYGYPKTKVYELAKTFAPHVRYLHAKNIKYPPHLCEQQRSPGWEYGRYAAPVTEGDLDFELILNGLFEAGVDCDIAVEAEEYMHRFDVAGKKRVIRKDVSFLRRLIVSKSALH